MNRPTIHVQLNACEEPFMLMKTPCCGAMLWASLDPTNCPVCGDALGEPTVQQVPDYASLQGKPMTRYWS